MNFASRRRPRPGENVVPLINVVFLLLIFFMLTSTLRPPEATSVSLPTTTNERTNEGTDDAPRDVPVLVLDAAGRVGWDGRILSPAELPEVSGLEGLDEGLEIRADRDVPARVLLPLLERLDEAGVPHVELVTLRVR